MPDNNFTTVTPKPESSANCLYNWRSWLPADMSPAKPSNDYNFPRRELPLAPSVDMYKTRTPDFLASFGGRFGPPFRSNINKGNNGILDSVSGNGTPVGGVDIDILKASWRTTSLTVLLFKRYSTAPSTATSTEPGPIKDSRAVMMG